MFKKLLICSLLSVSFAFAESDIYIRTKIDGFWTPILLNKVSTFMTNNGFGNLDHIVYEDKVSIVQDNIGAFVEGETKALLESLSEFVGLDLLKAQLDVNMEGIEFFNNGIYLKKVYPQNMRFDLDINGICVKAKKLSASLSIPAVNGKKFPIIKMALNNPELGFGEVSHKQCAGVSTGKMRSIRIPLEINPRIEGESFKVEVDNIDLSAIFSIIDNYKEMLRIKKFTPEDIEFSDINLKIGSYRTINILGEELKKFLLEQNHSYAEVMKQEIKGMIRNETIQNAIKQVNKVELGRTHWIDSDDFWAALKFDEIKAVETNKNLDIALDGAFCMTKNFVTQDLECVDKIDSVDRSGINADSSRYMDNLMSLRRASMVISVSDDYITDLIQATINAGYFEEMLQDAGVTLGPQGAKVLFNEEGPQGTFLMQVKYPIEKFHRFVIGLPKDKDLLLTIVAKVGMRIEVRDNIPVLIIRVNSMDMSKDTLLNGSEDFISTLKEAKRFKKLVMNMAKKELEPFIGQDALEIPFSEIRDLDVERVDFSSDGLGRAHLFWAP